MKQQYYFWLRLAAVLVLLCFLLFQLPTWFNTNKRWNAVPNASALVLELKNSLEIAPSLGDLNKLYPFQQFQKDVAYFDSLGLERKSVLAVLQGNTPEVFNWLFITEAQIDIRAELLPRLGMHYQLSVLHDTPVYEFPGRFAIAQYGDVFLYAPYPLQVEQAIEQLAKRKSLWKNKNLQALSNLESSGGVACYISFANLPDFLAPYIRPQQRGLVKKLRNLQDWARLDIRRDSIGTHLAGQWKAEAAAVQNSLSTKKQEAKVLSVLPDHTAFYAWGDLKKILQEDQLDLPQLGEFWNHIGAEGVVAYLEAHSHQPMQNRILLLGIEDKEQARAHIQTLEKLGNLKGTSYQMFQLYEVRGATLTYFTQVQDYLVFCESKSLLQTYLDKYIAGQVLANDIDFLRTLATQEGTTTAAFYAHTQRLLPFLQTLFRESYFSAIHKEIKQLEDTKGLHLTFEEDGAIEGNIAQPELLENTSILWKTTLAKNAVIAPQLVYFEGKKQLLIQDANHLLYSLDEGGQIIWTKQLEARIRSDFQAIDFFDDKRQHYFFNTAYHIHLIDAKGEAVGAFPMALQSPATNGMQIVDFDKTGFHHFFVACENGNVYGFNQKGRPLAHWSPKYIGLVEHPVQHFQWQQKDFILILNQSGKLHVFQRDASPRFPAYDLEHPKSSLLSYQETGKSPRIIVADDTGLVHVIHPNGENFNLALKIGANKQVKHAFADIWGDDRKDYMAISEQKLGIFAYDKKGFKKQFGGKLEYTQDTIFTVQTAGKARLGMLYRAGEQIILFNEEQRPERGFPLAGTTPFILEDLFDKEEQILIVGNRNSVYAYRIGGE